MTAYDKPTDSTIPGKLKNSFAMNYNIYFVTNLKSASLHCKCSYNIESSSPPLHYALYITPPFPLPTLPTLTACSSLSYVNELFIWSTEATTLNETTTIS